MDTAQTLHLVCDSRPFVAQRLQELDEVEGRILALRSQLLAAENRRYVIKRELAFYLIKRPGIHSLPLELLCYVFHLVDEDQATRNLRLSLVCKSWKLTLDGTPQLWSTIKVEWKRDLEDLMRAWAYAEACLNKSAATPLDITVDLRDLPYYLSYFADVLKAHFRCLALNPRFPESRLNDFTDVDMRRAPLDYDALVINSLIKLGGISEEHAPRWRSLQILLPWQCFDEVEKYLLYIRDACPNLVELKITVKDPFDLAEPCTIPPLPMLRRLETSEDLHFDYKYRYLCLLQYLELGHGASIHFLAHASSIFSSLHTLKIGIWEDEDFDTVPPTRFASLKLLEVNGALHHIILPALEAPQLDSLALQAKHQFELPIASLLSSLSTLSIRVVSQKNGASDTRLANLNLALLQAPRIQSISISGDATMTPEAVIGTVKAARSSGLALTSLREVRITEENDGGDSDVKLVHLVSVGITLDDLA